MKGKLVRWFDSKGFGFIEAGGESYFLHISQLPEGTQPKIDDLVKFEAVDAERGKQAQRASII